MIKNKEEILAKVYKLIDVYNQDQIPKLHKHEVNPNLPKGSRENYLYFTLPVSINFQRSSPAMWQSALETFNDPETNYLFFPEKIVQEKYEKVQKDLLKHKLSLQKNKHTQIWLAISNTLHNYYSDDPRLVIRAAQNCVVRTKNLMQVEQKERFPYLRGPKMANYWLYILHNFTDVRLRNLHKISIIPDTHVIQSSKVLGLTDSEESPDKIAELWFELLKGTEIIPIDIHPILWNWSRAGFKPEVQ